MKKKLGLSLLAVLATAALGVTTSVQAQQPAMRSCDIEGPSPAKGPKSFRLSHSSFDSGRFG